ncbi:D-alanyl-D-alanine carboxypeptidase family protein, partial [Methylobacterium sp. A54F]
KSVNHVACAIGENIAGSEERFAELMAAKARALGMGRTHYANASGLPDAEQITTARDQRVLARAIQDRFPRYYRYFQTRSFAFRGRVIGNHNRLLGAVQ